MVLYVVKGTLGHVPATRQHDARGRGREAARLNARYPRPVLIHAKKRRLTLPIEWIRFLSAQFGAEVESFVIETNGLTATLIPDPPMKATRIPPEIYEKLGIPTPKPKAISRPLPPPPED